MAKITDLEHKWAKELGRVMLAFGNIEWALLKFIEVYPRDNIYASVRKMPLKAKINLITDLLKDGRMESGEVDLIASFLREAFKNADTRNLIAHNPLVLNVYQKKDGNLGSNEVIRSLYNQDRHISYEELEKVASEMERLVSHMFMEVTPIFDKYTKS